MRTIFKILPLFFLVCLLCITAKVNAQGKGQHKNKLMRKIQKTIWTAGISGIVIDDDANAFKNLFNVKESWNLLPFPTRATFDGYIDKGISAEGSFAYMRLNKVRVISDQKGFPSENITLLNFDASIKYDVNYQTHGSFNPYLTGGFGYTYRSLTERKHAVTGNFGLGLTLWMNRGYGLNVQTMAKFALNNPASKNYLMHSLGLVYRFNLIRGYMTPERLGRRKRR